MHPDCCARVINLRTSAPLYAMPFASCSRVSERCDWCRKNLQPCSAGVIQQSTTCFCMYRDIRAACIYSGAAAAVTAEDLCCLLLEVVLALETVAASGIVCVLYENMISRCPAGTMTRNVASPFRDCGVWNVRLVYLILCMRRRRRDKRAVLEGEPQTERISERIIHADMRESASA